MAKVAAGALLILIGAALPAEWLRFDREAVVDGQVWRLLSCHLAHDGLFHLAQNLLALLALGVMFRDKLVRPVVVFASALAVGAGVWAFTEVRFLVGASGLLHGCAAGLLHPILLPLVGLKVGYEQIFGSLPMSGPNVLVASHLYGAIGGLAAGLALEWRRRTTQPASPRA